MTRPPGRTFHLVGLAILILLACACAAAFAHTHPSATQGRIALPPGIDEPLPLRGEWAFAWQRYVDPGWQELPTREFAPVPAPWNDVTAGGKPKGENGFGSYMLQVDCEPGESLAVEATGQRTASRLFVNGRLVAQHGRLGNSAATTEAAIHSRTPLSEEFRCPLRITLHVANFEHRAGGFVRPLAIGTADALARAREGRIVQHSVLLAAYGLTALVALIFHAVRRRERTALVYGTFCLAMAVYTDMIGERLLLRGVAPIVSWVPYMRVEYLAWIASMALFLLTLHGLFPGEVRRRVVQGVLAALAAAAVATLVLPPSIYSYVAAPGQLIAVAVGLYMARSLVSVPQDRRFDARVLLGGMVAVVVALAIDFVFIDTPRPDRKFAPFGFALFLLSPAVVIARRLSRALNAEERSRTLEENARLREDVERMSRHDLKTPLNSMLGATRLLVDAGGLDKDQRDLVAVVQRAALRMLEMVNLSLGLYRMETGSYELRAKDVDLQDVVTRAMVDLHGHAEASQVALHLRGSRREPLYVRGEELLCYSIIANIVKNAIEATPTGGTVTLDLQRSQDVVLTVHNPGVVAPEVAARFFEKYVTSGKRGGTGLGTYSARLMARAQHGDLAMRTGAGGTTITVTLPPATGEPVHDETHAQGSQAEAWLQELGPRTVLVVDDDQFSRWVERRMLPTPPFEVDTAGNAVQAEEAMARRWPDFAVLDMQMPGRSGLELLRWLRAREAEGGRPRCSVVMLSGDDDPGTAQKALEAGADRYLAKPVDRDALLAALRELDAERAAARAPADEMRGGLRVEPGTTASGPAGPDGSRVEPGTTANRPAGADPATAGATQAAEPGRPAPEVVRIDPEWVDYFPEFIRIQLDNLRIMEAALGAGNRAQLQFVAHRTFGGLATMGLSRAASEARVLEQHAAREPLDQLRSRVEKLRDYLARVQCESA